MRAEVLFDRAHTVDSRLDDTVIGRHTALRQALAARSQLVWGEHCTECAYPTCYSSCAFYTPRKDGHCRRFETGFERLAQSADFKQVRFRQWGKIEAEGPARAFEPEIPETSFTDRAAQFVLGSPFLPRPVGRKSAHLLQTAAVSKRRASRDEAFDAFVLEAMSGDGREHDLTLTILNIDGPADKLFQAHVKVTPAYGRAVIDAGSIAAHIDLSAPYLVQIEPLNEAAGRTIVFGFCDFVRWVGEPLQAVPAIEERDVSPPAKVLVWDLDDTLWTGTLAEDGLSGLRVRREAVAAIVALDERGILQSIVSKNDPDEAMNALEHFGLAEYFVSPQISWEPKSTAIGRLSEALNLGVDSFVFIDDQSFERAEVLNAFPQIRVLSHDQAAALAGMACFEVPVTAESRDRRKMYRADEKRQAAFTASGADYRAFLGASGMTLSLEALSDNTCARVYELSQRTNQLNLNGRKYAEAEVRALRDATDIATVAMRASDRYGDYGLIGFVEADLAAGHVRQFFMSCRVQKKRVEEAFFEWLRARMRARGATLIRVDYSPSDRNAAAKAMLERLGFRSDGDGAWSRSLTEPFSDAELVQVEDRSGIVSKDGFADRWAEDVTAA
jgi:FkbH-like protein